MAIKKFDFNSLDTPVLEVAMRDEAKTVFRITVPTQSLIERLVAVTPQLTEVFSKKNGDAVKAVYDLIADLISCNLDNKKITGDELQNVYKIDLYALIAFVNVYTEFIGEVKNAKN